MECSPPVFKEERLPLSSPFLSCPYGQLNREEDKRLLPFSNALLIEFKDAWQYLSSNVFFSQFYTCLNCLLVTTDPTPCICILPSHRALRLLISPTENEHSAVSVVMHTTWLLYRLLQYKACSYSNPAPRMKPIKVLFLSLALCFFVSPHFSLNLHICASVNASI